MKSLADTYILKKVSSSATFKNEMDKVDVKTMRIPTDNISFLIDTMRRMINDPNNANIISALGNSEIIPIKFNTPLSIPSFLPFWLIANEGKPTALVNFTNFTAYGDIEDDRAIKNPSIFYTLFNGGYITLKTYKNFDKITKNFNIVRKSTEAFMHLFKKIFSSLSLELYPIEFEQLQFMTAKYFLLAMMEKDFNASIDDLAFDITKSTRQKAIITGIDKTEDVNLMYKGGLDKFVLHLQALMEKTLSSFNLSVLIQKYTRYYGSNTSLALEYLPYFYFLISDSVMKTPLTYFKTVENTLTVRNLDELYNSLCDLLKG